MLLIFWSLIILLMILMVLNEIVKKYNLTNNTFILIPVILLIFNIVITSKFIETKDSLNTSTFMSYNLSKDAFRKINYTNKMENERDMRKLVNVIKEINKNLEILEFNLRHSKLAHDNERFHLLINKLKNSLNAFISQHNKYFANNKTATSQKLNKYEKLKIELVMIEHYLNKLGTSKSNEFGIQIYRIGLMGKEKYDWYSKLEKRVFNIEGIVNS